MTNIEVPSRTEGFFNELRLEILGGQRKPGVRLNLQQLQEQYQVSLSPIREGLSRLVAEGLLIPSGQRGYRVAPVSVDELLDVESTRMNIEISALRASLTDGDEEWELRVLASHRRLQNLERSKWDANEVKEWEGRHHAFHSELISACKSPITISFCRILHEKADRYRRLYLSTHNPLNSNRSVLIDEHQVLCDAAVSRDVQTACETLRTHIHRTSRLLLETMISNSDN